MIAFTLGAIAGAVVGVIGMAALTMASNEDDADEAGLGGQQPAEPPHSGAGQ